MTLALAARDDVLHYIFMRSLLHGKVSYRYSYVVVSEDNKAFWLYR